MAEEKKPLEIDPIMLVLAGEDRNFDRKDVEDAIELVRQDLTAKEAEAQRRKWESQKPKTGQDTAGNSSNPIDEDVKRLLELAPRLPEIITDMWNWSALLQGWQFVATATQNKYGARLTTLSREVYGAYKKSKGSPERLQELIKTHTPLQVEQKTLQQHLQQHLQQRIQHKLSRLKGQIQVQIRPHKVKGLPTVFPEV